MDWSREVGRAGAEERRNNPRSKCAKLRYAVRSGLPVPLSVPAGTGTGAAPSPPGAAAPSSSSQ